MKKIPILFLCFSLLFSFGCTKDNKTKIQTPEKLNMNYPYTFRDYLGNEITLYEEPERIAVLFSSYAEIWQLAGGEVDITVSESIERGFANESCILVDDESGQASIDTELLISSKPDFVIGTADDEIQREAGKLCSENGIPTALFKVETLNDYLEVLKIFTDLLNKSENYRIYGTDIKKQTDKLFKEIDTLNTNKSVLFIHSSSSKLSAKTADESFVCAMLNELGTYNIADRAPVLLDRLSAEEILLLDPDIIFISATGDEEAAKKYMDSLLQNEQWSSLSAVKEAEFYYLPKDLFRYKPNAKWAEAYLYLANLIYPELNFDY